MKYKKKSTKSEAVKGAVIAKHVSGSSNSKISRDLGISRPTVIRILSEAEIDSLVQQGRSGLAELVPDAVKKYGGGVKSNVDRAESFLERMKVLPAREAAIGSNTINNFIGIGSLARPDTRKPVLEQPKAT